MSKINKIIFPFLFLIQYLGIGAVAQVTVLMLFIVELFRGKTISLTLADGFFLTSILIISAAKLIYIPFFTNFLLFKFYWGFVVFYFYLKLSDFKIDYLFFLWLVVIVTLADFTLINTFVPVELMKNTPQEHAEIISEQVESSVSFFNRCYGLASSPTVSATIIVVLLSAVFTFQREKYRDYHILIALIALFCISSGTGFLLFLSFIFIRFQLYKSFKLFIGLILLLLFAYFVSNNSVNDQGAFMRLSSDYYSWIIDYKVEQVSNVLNLINKSYFETFFGVNYNGSDVLRIMSDFGWIDILECYGFVGIGVLIIFLILKRKIGSLPIVFILVAYFHYPSLGSIPGQILFASLLVSSKSEQVFTNDKLLKCN